MADTKTQDVEMEYDSIGVPFGEEPLGPIKAKVAEGWELFGYMSWITKHG